MIRLSLFLGTAFIAFGFISAPSFAQDWQADPTYGYTQLTQGFEPAPHEVRLTAGGSVDISQTVGAECAGFVANSPDFDLYYEAGRGTALAISVASTADTTLLINAPDGRWYCDDDSGNGLNPALVFRDPDDGLYNIWVGTFGRTMAPSVLSFSEVSAN